MIESVDESGKTRWLLAGQQLLRMGGIRSVKIDALVAETGLTTGSFYHHFPNIAAFRVELAEFYGSVQVGATLATIGDEAPDERIRRLVRIARDDRLHPLDAAMRDWAGSDPIAADAVRSLDATLLEHLADAFRSLGHDERGARIRASLLFASGVARVHVPWTIDDPTDDVITLLARLDP